MKNPVIFATCIICVFFAGCRDQSSRPYKKEVSVVQWNVQCFFDGVTSGSEYEEYRNKDIWSESRYKMRLERLAKALAGINADIIVLEEIEDAAVLQDIVNFTGYRGIFRRPYSYSAFARSRGCAFGVGVISCLPLKDIRTHSVFSMVEGLSVPPLRETLEVTVCNGGEEVVLLVNHWKSRLEGDSLTEHWRTLQEKSLSAAIEAVAGEKGTVICGDFNKDIEDFIHDDEGNCVVLAGKTAVSHPSCISTGGSKGSYFYRGEWSLIDNFFCRGAVLNDCRILDDGLWCDKDTGVPHGFNIWKGSGYSDHLPVSCVISFAQRKDTL